MTILFHATIRNGIFKMPLRRFNSVFHEMTVAAAAAVGSAHKLRRRNHQDIKANKSSER